METIDRALLTFLLNSLWQVSLIAAVAALACRLMRHGPARHRHAVCVAALAAALLLPAASVRRRTSDTPDIAVPQQFDVARTLPAAAVAAPVTAPPQRSIPLPGTAASLAMWAAGLFLLFRVAQLARATMKTLAICRAASPGEAESCPAWTRCRAAFGLDDVELRWSAAISGPVTAARIVILPDSLRGASETVLATAIGHEMAHIARRDFAANVWCELLYLPISFHPAAAWLRHEVDRSRELACDDLVTARLLDPAVYASSIVNIATTLSGLPRPGYTLGVFDGDILEERVRRLVSRPSGDRKRAGLVLAAVLASLAVCVIAASTLAISARAQSPSQQEMRQAGDAYNAGDYTAAVEHFEKAVALEPGAVKPRLFLAAAYLRLDTQAFTAKASEQYAEVLRRDPKNVAAMFGLVTLNGPQRAAESRDLMMRAIEIDPKSKQAYYTAGVLDWMLAFAPIRDANGGMGPGMYRRVGDPALRARLLPAIEEGYRMLQIAIDLDPEWSNPMAYMNLLHRLNAAIAADQLESDRLMAQADEWVRKAMGAVKARPPATKALADRIDVESAAPAPIPSVIPPPPPPPPPAGGFRGNGDK